RLLARRGAGAPEAVDAVLRLLLVLGVGGLLDVLLVARDRVGLPAHPLVCDRLVEQELRERLEGVGRAELRRGVLVSLLCEEVVPALEVLLGFFNRFVRLGPRGPREDEGRRQCQRDDPQDSESSHLFAPFVRRIYIITRSAKRKNRHEPGYSGVGCAGL